MEDKVIVEVAFKLDKGLYYYEDILKNNGLSNVFSVVTHDIYYTKDNLDGMSECQMKNACIRLRSCNNGDYDIQNCNDKSIVSRKVKNNFISLFIFDKKMQKKGYVKVFDTIKHDYHYYKDGMSSRIQLQDTKDIGLLLYYDNEKYYGIKEDEQRNLLIDELNSYGFSFNYDMLGFDKLRTLYYKEDKYSNNQNTTYNEQKLKRK